MMMLKSIKFVYDKTISILVWRTLNLQQTNLYIKIDKLANTWTHARRLNKPTIDMIVYNIEYLFALHETTNHHIYTYICSNMETWIKVRIFPFSFKALSKMFTSRTCVCEFIQEHVSLYLTSPSVTFLLSAISGWWFFGRYRQECSSFYVIWIRNVVECLLSFNVDRKISNLWRNQTELSAINYQLVRHENM